jgi:type IV secretion system protein VirB9
MTSRVERRARVGAAARSGALLAAGVLVVSLGAGVGARAEGGPPGRSRLDPRVRTVVFQDGQVVPIVLHTFRVAVIEFAPDEVIQTVRSGDTEAWETTEDPGKHRLFVKSRLDGVRANLIAVTDRRTYVFALESRKEGDRSGESVFRVRFSYPEEEQARREAQQRQVQEREQALVATARSLRPEQLNFSYGYAGDSGLVPDLLFDDGTSTFFRFRDARDLPGIFVVEAGEGGEKRESLANYRVEQGDSGRVSYVVVHRVADQFSLRVGDRLACIKRERPRGETPDVAAAVNAPRLRAAESGWWRWANPLHWFAASAEGAER